MDKPIRVLQVMTILNRGGAETMVMNYYRNIDRTKVQFDFLVHRDDIGVYEDEIKKMGGKIYKAMPIRPGNYKKYFAYLDAFFKEHNEYKIVHSHNQENSGFVLYYAKKNNVPVRIAHSHISKIAIDTKLPFRKYANYYLKKSVTHRMACGIEAGKALYGDKKFMVLKNAIDSNQFSHNETKRQSIRSKLKILDDCYIIGHVGRFNKQKNHIFLLKIFKEYLKINPNSKLLLIGDGILREKIEKKADELGIIDRVIMMGVKSNVNDYMQAMDVIVFPSVSEGLPVSIIEAQANGLPCLLATTISKEVAIIDDIYFLSLQDSFEKWAKKINFINLNCEKKNSTNEIIANGYDIKNAALDLQEFYFSKVGLSNE